MTEATTVNSTPALDPADREAEIAALKAGLDEAKRKGLMVRYGPRGHTTVRTQFQMTAHEHKMLQTMKHVSSFTVGRPVAAALLMRVGLSYLLNVCDRALKDPAAAERLKADIMAAREARVAEYLTTGSDR